MADDIKTAADSVEAMIEKLRGEVDRISNTLADNGFDLVRDTERKARHLADSMSHQAVEVADAARHEIAAVTQTARENPTTTATILTFTALAGVAVGMLLAAQGNSGRRW